MLGLKITAAYLILFVLAISAPFVLWTVGGWTFVLLSMVSAETWHTVLVCLWLVLLVAVIFAAMVGYDRYGVG